MTSDHPQTWHYGLVARYWAEKRHDAAEAEFLKPYIEAGQPALDVGCGTRRVLIPLLHEGFDVDGIDILPDMLAYARARAQREGFTPNLHAQPMHELDLPRTYRTIYSCAILGLTYVPSAPLNGVVGGLLSGSERRCPVLRSLATSP